MTTVQSHPVPEKTAQAHRSHAARRAAGFAMIEVLIAVFVLAVGILGAGAMQTIGLQANQGALLRSQAMLLANDMMDRIRANRAAKASYFGIDTNASGVRALTTPACIGMAAGCSAPNLATADIVDWTTTIRSAAVLPEGRGRIEGLATGDNVRITVSWNETDWVDGVRADSSNSYSIVAAIGDL